MPQLPDGLIATLADRYRVEREIGSGGMATVYLAEDLKHHRRVALKILKADLAAALGAERFLREIEITAQLNHPHILPLLDSGRTGGQGDRVPDFLYYVMPYVEGGSLRHRLNHEAPLELADAVRITTQVASALDHAHRHGVVHRDVKPENILFTEGHAIVADFGIAKAITSAAGPLLTRSGFPVGTPGYMSPEQAAGRTTPDERTDVFGLACVAYEMLVGETPEMWPTEDALRVGRLLDASAAHREQLDRLPGRLEQVLVKGLAMRPADRFERPGAFAAALAAAAEHSPRLPDGDVRRILDRAAQLDAEHATDEPALSIGGVEQIAAEVGITPARVREAAREVMPAPAPAVPAQRPVQAVVVPSKNRLVVERTVPRRIHESAHEALVAEIQANLKVVGLGATLGNTLTWSSLAAGGPGRDVRITVTPEGGSTRIHIEESTELHGIQNAFPVWGGVGMGVLGLAFAAAFGLPESAAALVAVTCGIGGGIGTVRAVKVTMEMWHEPELKQLAERLAEVVERGGAGR